MEKEKRKRKKAAWKKHYIRIKNNINILKQIREDITSIKQVPNAI